MDTQYGLEIAIHESFKGQRVRDDYVVAIRVGEKDGPLAESRFVRLTRVELDTLINELEEVRTGLGFRV